MQKEKEEQSELQARIDVLNALGKNATMPSEAADVIAFNDGENWRYGNKQEDDDEDDAENRNLLCNYTVEISLRCRTTQVRSWYTPCMV